jgi:aspartate oxidase
MAAGLHGEQLLAAMSRLETLVTGEVAAIVGERSIIPERTEDSGQRIINRPTAREPGFDENGE